MTLDHLRSSHCTPRKGKEFALGATELDSYLAIVTNWQKTPDGDAIYKEFRFNDFYRTIAFVNAIAWMANQEDHHPDLEVGYSRCLVRYSTHDVGGLSLNDFICAAKVDELLNHA